MTKPKAPAETIISFHFDNPEAAHHFLIWLTECGEQDYWQAMQFREEEEEGDITAVDFDYWSMNDGETLGPKVKMKCGRLDNPEPYLDEEDEESE